ncbi:MAG: Nif11-like leader peptide family natural product precursor [Prochlorococcaceae cyanobacterium]
MFAKELSLFVMAIRFSPEMRRLLAQARTPGEIVDIANQCGYAFTVKDLQQASGDLAADHWAWGGKGSEWKQSFFERDLAV